MAIEFINAASTALTASSVISITRPTNSTAGDLLVAHIFIEDNTDRITSTRVPAGWSTAVNQTAGTRAVRQYVHYKVLTTSEPSSYTWYLDAADEVVGMISAYRGIDTTTPIGNISISTNTGASSSVAVPEITVTGAGNFLIYSAGNAAGSTTWTPPTSFAERVESRSSTGTGNISACLADMSPASTGATGTITGFSAVSDYFVASVVEVKAFDPLVILTVTDGACTSVAEEAALSQELSLEVSDSAGVQVAESADLAQEHNLEDADGAVASVGENVVLEVISAAGDIVLYASDYISASAADPTTAQLTAPVGKDAGTDFQAGLISDDTNPLPAIDLDQDKYTEIEFCIQAGPSASGSYEFRITSNGIPLTEYLQTPILSVGVTDSLTVADGYSASVAETADLVQEHLLVADDAATVSTADDLQLEQEHGLSATDAFVAAVVDSLILDQEHTLTASDAVVKAVSDTLDLLQEQSLEAFDGYVASVGDTVSLEQEQLLVVVDAATVGVAEFAVLVQEHNPAVVDSAVVTVAEVTSLVQEHEFGVVSDGAVLAVSDSAELSQEHNLLSSDSAVVAFGNAVELVQEQALVSDDSVVKAVAEDSDLNQEHVATVADGFTKSVADTESLIQEHNLTATDGVVRSAGDEIGLGIEGLDTLVPSDSVVKAIVDALDLPQEHNLVSVDSVIKSVADDADLIQEHLAVVSDGAVKTAADSEALIQEHNFVLVDGAVQTAGDDLVISTEGLDTLSLSDGVVKTVGDVLDISQELDLSLSDSVVKSVSETVELISIGLDTLSMQDGVVKSVSDTAQLSEESSLVVLDSNSQAVIDTLLLLQEHVLETSDCYNPNHLDNVDLEIEHWLEISSGAVIAAADIARIYSFILGPIIDPYILSTTVRRDMGSTTPAYMVKSVTSRRTIKQGDM